MDPVLARCGYRCDLCMAYRPNVEAHPEYQQELSDGWFTYFGFRIPPENIVCDGCLSPATETLDKGCPVRPCVQERGLDHCAQCDEYICAKLQELLVSIEDIERKLGHPIPAEDRRRFVQPYENVQRLADLRTKSA